MYRLGACVRRARLQARLGSPTPTKTTSPSRSSRAALMVISSAALYFISIFSIIDRGCRAAGNAQAPVHGGAQLFPIRGAVRQAVYPRFQIGADGFGRLAE